MPEPLFNKVAETFVNLLHLTSLALKKHFLNVMLNCNAFWFICKIFTLIYLRDLKYNLNFAVLLRKLSRFIINLFFLSPSRETQKICLSSIVNKFNRNKLEFLFVCSRIFEKMFVYMVFVERNGLMAYYDLV